MIGSIRKSYSSIFGILTSESNKFDLPITVFIVLIHIRPFVTNIERLWEWKGDTFEFAITTWLTSYEGGFIRRGLSGEFIKFLTSLTNILPHQLILLITYAVFLALLMWTIRICKNKFPMYVLFSSAFFGLSMRYDIIPSKDYFLVLLYLVSLKFLFSNINSYGKFILMNTICSIAILFHELYFFLFLPLTILVFNLHENRKILSIRCVYYFAIPLLIFVLVLFNSMNSTENIAKISDFWNSVYLPRVKEFSTLSHDMGFLAYLQHSWYNLHLTKVMKFWETIAHGVLWVPLFWLALWYFCGLVVAKIVKHYDDGKEDIFLILYYFCTLCSLPVYVLATDYGRWISLTLISCFLTTILIASKVQLPEFVNKFQLRHWTGNLKLWQKLLIVTCFGLPLEFYSFGNYYYATPIWYPLHVFDLIRI